MALQALWAPETQFQNKNGSLLVHGKIYVQYRGRSQLAETYRDPDGAYQNTNPLLTDSDGRVLCYADDSFSYTAVVCDFYGNELFSFDPIPCGSAGGGGSASAGTAEHWLGWNGASVAVPSNTETRLRMPAGLDNVDYDGGFLKRIESSGTEMVLEEGLYLVNAVIRFQQSSSDLTNEISNVVIHTRDFESGNMQEVGATFRDEAGPDSSSDIHTISLTFIRHAYVDDVGSDRLKFAVDTPNTWTSCYIQNLQIAKLGSSVGGGGSADIYTAGDYISIENDTISVTGIDPDAYATHDELQSATSAFITSADLSSYATEQWVLDKHYITSADIPPIPENVVTSADLAQVSGAIEQDISDVTSAMTEALADKMDKSSSADFYPRYDNPEGYLTSVPSEYVTESEMSGYVQDHTSAFLTSADLPDLSDMATQTWVTEQHYITSADVPPQVEYSAGDNIDITDHVVSVTDSSQLIAGDNVSITVSGNDYIISAQVQETSGYVTEQEMNDAIQSATSAFITSADIPPIPEDVVTSGELANVSADIVNQIPSLDGYATEQYVQNYTSSFITSADVPEYSAGQYIDITNKTISVSPVKSLVAGENVSITASGNNYVISSQVQEDVVTSGELATVSGEIVNQIPSLQGYATESYVTEHTSAFITSADLPDVSDMATKTWVGEQGYLTSIPSEYVTDTELESAISGKQDTLTFGYDSSDKINAINGSAIAGGGGGGHEYSGANGVYVDNENEVIGLDTSASNAIETVIENSGAWGGAGLPISAGPGIKVGLENGVLMISNDETELWSGMLSGTNSYATLSEQVSGFKYIQVEGYTHNGPQFTWATKTPVNPTGETYGIGLNTWTDGNAKEISMSRYSFSGDRITLHPGYRIADSTWAGSKNVYVTRVVGIGRKST